MPVQTRTIFTAEPSFRDLPSVVVGNALRQGPSVAVTVRSEALPDSKSRTERTLDSSAIF